MRVNWLRERARERWLERNYRGLLRRARVVGWHAARDEYRHRVAECDTDLEFFEGRMWIASLGGSDPIVVQAREDLLRRVVMASALLGATVAAHAALIGAPAAAAVMGSLVATALGLELGEKLIPRILT